MEKWKIEVLVFYAIVGFLLNLWLHAVDDEIPMWTMDGGFEDLLPLNVIVDILLSWIRILRFMSEFELLFTIMGIFVLPLILVLGTIIVGIVGVIVEIFG